MALCGQQFRDSRQQVPLSSGKALLFSVSHVRQGLPHNPESGLKHIYQIDINVD
jgi:hypothetical protein